jgi:hypothetical protein
MDNLLGSNICGGLMTQQRFACAHYKIHMRMMRVDLFILFVEMNILRILEMMKVVEGF